MHLPFVKPKSERLGRVLKHWQTLCDCSDVPERAAFSPTDLAPKDLPYLILLNVLGGGTDFEYRLVGSGVVGYIGHEFTGQNLSVYQSQHEEPEMRDAYIAAVADRVPTLYTGSLKRFDKEFVHYERLALPFRKTAEDRAIDQILAVFEFQYVNTYSEGRKSGVWPNAI